jgi:hypothetical protein
LDLPNKETFEDRDEAQSRKNFLPVKYFVIYIVMYSMLHSIATRPTDFAPQDPGKSDDVKENRHV